MPRNIPLFKFSADVERLTIDDGTTRRAFGSPRSTSPPSNTIRHHSLKSAKGTASRRRRRSAGPCARRSRKRGGSRERREE